MEQALQRYNKIMFQLMTSKVIIQSKETQLILEEEEEEEEEEKNKKKTKTYHLHKLLH